MRPRARRVRAEEPGRFSRACPYCFTPVVWAYFGDVVPEWPYVDLKTERPQCMAHGPIPFWVVIDNAHPVSDEVRKPAILAVASVDDPPGIRVLPRFLRKPILVADARPFQARWKQARRRQPTLLNIDLAAVRRAEWRRG